LLIDYQNGNQLNSANRLFNLLPPSASEVTETTGGRAAVTNATMTVGMNLPWFNYGWDIGPPLVKMDGSTPTVDRFDRYDPPPASGGPQGNSPLEAKLAQFVSLGITHVRWILLGDCWNLGTPTFANKKWSYNVPGSISGSQFCSDFEKILVAFGKAKLKILPCLINHLFFYPGRVDVGPPSPRPSHALPIDRGASSIGQFLKDWCKRNPPNQPTADWTRFIKGGKADVLDPVKTKQFLDNVLEPLLEVSKKYRDTIAAWEICSEPDYAVAACPFFIRLAKEAWSNITDDLMAPFLMAGIDHIYRAGFLATIGFQKADQLQKYMSTGAAGAYLSELEKRGAFIRQFHFYPELGSDKLAPVPKGMRCILGEFASRYDTATNKSFPSIWPPDVGIRLADIEAMGFEAAYVWSSQPDEQSDFGPATTAAIANFVKSSHEY
jgi:hypothetical protein